MKYKPEGFPQQRLFRLPDELAQRADELPICRNLTVTDTGFFPVASGHRVKRKNGSPSSILLYCVEGKGWVKSGDVHLDVDPGSMIWIEAGVPHQYGSQLGTPWRIYWLHVTGDLLTDWSTWLGDLSQGVSQWRINDRSAMGERFEQIWRLHEDGGTDRSLLRMSAEAMALLAFAVSDRQLNEGSSGHLEAAIEKSILWMREHLTQNASLEQCAEAAGMSISHYSAIFKQRTGLAPLKYFTRLRLRKASEWLEDSHQTIQEVSEKLGYANPFHFSRAFKHFTGLSPRDYRKQLKETLGEDQPDAASRS